MQDALALASDDDLSRAWQAGDRHAAATLFARHRRAVLRFLERRLGPTNEDAAQDVWTAAVATIHRYQRRSSFRTWLFAIANNHVRVRYRNRQRRTRLAIASEEQLESPLEPDEVHEERERLHRLAVGLSALPGPLQRILSLYYFEGHTASEIGRRLAIPENTVRSRVRRARALLGDAIGRPCPATPGGHHPITRWLDDVAAMAI